MAVSILYKPYTRIPWNLTELVANLDDFPEKLRRPGQNIWVYVFHGALAFCVLLTCLNTYFIHVLTSSKITPSSPDYFNGQTLPRPNQFIGLENIDRNRSDFEKPKPFANWASILTQVNVKQPDYVYPDDTRRRFSHVGTISPDDKQFLVNDSVSWMLAT